MWIPSSKIILLSSFGDKATLFILSLNTRETEAKLRSLVMLKRSVGAVLEELLSNTQLDFLYFLVELLVQLLLSGTSPVLILLTTVQLISFDISPHCSTWLYSLIERCCAPAYKGDTKDDTSKLSIFLHRDRSVSASESR